MDISNLKPHDWVLTASGAVMLILGFALDWRTFEGVSGDGPFDFFFTGGIAWLLISAVGIVAFLVAAGVIKATLNWSVIFVAATGVGALLMLLRLILGGGDESAFGTTIEFGRGPGMYVAFVAAAAALGGAFWKFTDSGGNLKDLTNPDTIKGAFKQTGE